MKKTIKVFLGVLISALVLGFTSCQQANGPQDVKITDYPTQTYDYWYSATGTFTPRGTTTAVAASGDVNVWWTKSAATDTNYTTFRLQGNINYKTSSTATSYSSTYINYTITKINGKYYMQQSINGESKLVDVSSYISGSPESSSFTFTQPVSTYVDGLNLTLTKK